MGRKELSRSESYPILGLRTARFIRDALRLVGNDARRL